MKPSTFIATWLRRTGVGAGIVLAGFALGQDEADPSIPAMEGESFTSEASPVTTENAATVPDPAPPAPAEASKAGAAPAEADPAQAVDPEFKEDVLEGEVEVIDLQEAEVYDDTWDSTSKGRVAQDVSGQVSVEEIVEPPGEYHYAAFGRPNPFTPPRVTETAAAPLLPPTAVTPQGEINIAGTEIPVVSALQTYPLDRLELKGIWQLQTGEMRAIVMTPEKEGIIVKANDPIAAGKVLSIAKDFVMVRQYRLRPDGTREFNDERLNLGSGYDGPPQGSVKLIPGKDPEFSTPKAREETLPVPAAPAAQKAAMQPIDGKAPALPAVK